MTADADTEKAKRMPKIVDIEMVMSRIKQRNFSNNTDKEIYPSQGNRIYSEALVRVDNETAPVLATGAVLLSAILAWRRPGSR